MKALFLLITLLESWETFCIAISNSTPVAGLTSANVESSLLTEEVNRTVIEVALLWWSGEDLKTRRSRKIEASLEASPVVAVSKT